MEGKKPLKFLSGKIRSTPCLVYLRENGIITLPDINLSTLPTINLSQFERYDHDHNHNPQYKHDHVHTDSHGHYDTHPNRFTWKSQVCDTLGKVGHSGVFVRVLDNSHLCVVCYLLSCCYHVISCYYHVYVGDSSLQAITQPF